MHNTLERISIRITEAEEWISDLEKEILPRNQTQVSCIAGRFFTI